jgi:hypothetical protein
MAERKACSRCSEVRPLTEFHADRRAPDGKRSECKACTQASVKRWRESNSDAHRAADARYKAGLPGEVKRAWSRSYLQRHPDRRAEQRRRFRREHPDKARAHNALNKAVQEGRLQRPAACQWCGAGGRIEGSHRDYSRPLEVLWLCVSCHRRRDRHGA